MLDTNIVLAIASPESNYHWVYQAIRQSPFSLVVSTDITEEYAEKLELWFGVDAANKVLADLLFLPTVEKTEPSYFWRLITTDPDDDKFVDAYLAGNANLLVSNDGHFKALFAHPFPPVHWIKFTDFMAFLEGGPVVLQKPKQKPARKKREL